jgi:drug/metabolite transporter (DMT)-like permease
VSGSKKGYVLVMIAAVMWASSGTAGKALFENGLLPLDLVQIRVTFSSIVLAVFLAVFSRDLLRVRLWDVVHFFVLGGVLMALVQFTYFYAISKIQVVAAILLQYLSPVFIGMYSMLLWGEKPTTPKVSALFLAISGSYLVVGGYNIGLLHMNIVGILVGLASAVLFSAYALIGEKAMHRCAPWTVVFYCLVFAALSLNVFCSPLQYLKADYTWHQWALILYVVIAGTVLPFGFYFVGINYIRSTRAAITANLEPISAGFMAYFLLGETLEPLQLLGALLVVVAITLLQLNREQDELSPAVVRGNGNNTT